MNTKSASRVVRRLLAADGYLELNLPALALEELDAIESAGLFEAEMQFLRGEAFRTQKRYGDAIVPLQEAARLLPDPHYRRAWLSLSECYRKRGQTDLARVAEIAARTGDTLDREDAPMFDMHLTFSMQGTPRQEF